MSKYVEKRSLIILTLCVIAMCVDGIARSPNIKSKLRTAPEFTSTSNVVDALQECAKDDVVCSDETAFLSIKSLHRQLDDDRDGQVDIEESDEFLREELQYENGRERQKAFHNNKKPITVNELWEAWKKSNVRNWTVEETIEWLTDCVELPEYKEAFLSHGITGASLPRFATDTHYLLTLGIKNPIHRRKISLKATDVVLFGSGTHRSLLKDSLLVVSLLVAFVVCWLAYIQHRWSKKQMNQMMKDMESLQMAEENLFALQEKLDQARQMQASVSFERDELEKKLRRGDHSNEQGSEEEVVKVHQLEEELSLITDELQRARRQLESKHWLAPPTLQLWMQLTYEMESHNFNMKKVAAEEQFKIAKEWCEKLKKKRSTLLGSFRIAHGGSIDDVDEKILLAKAALTELTQSLKERLHRWEQIEMLCGFNIAKNPGLTTLQTVLMLQDGAPHLHHNGNLETIEDEMDSGMSISAVPPSYPLATWHGDMLAQQNCQRRTLIHRDSSNSLYDSHSNSVIASSVAVPSNHKVGGVLLPAAPPGTKLLGDTARSRSTGLEHLEKLTHASIKMSCSENSLHKSSPSVVDISEKSSTVVNGHRAVFTVGGNAESSPEAEEDSPVEHEKNSLWHKTKSHSHDQSSPPREVADGLHSQSDPSFDVCMQGSLSSVSQVRRINSNHAERPKSMTLATAVSTVVRSKKLSLRGSPPVLVTPLDEEKSSDSSSTIDEEVKKQKKKKMFLRFSQKLRKLF